MLTPIPGSESIPGEVALWIGTGGLALGAFILLALGVRASAEHRTHFGLGFFICAIAASAYFAMGTGQLDYRVGTGDAILQLPRYIDWVITTPLLLLSIWLVAMPRIKGEAPDVSRERAGLLGGILLADVLMVATGTFAALNTGGTERWIWFTLSSVFFVISLGLLAGPTLRLARARSGKNAPNVKLATRATVALTVIWLAYPIVWGLGPFGAEVFGNAAESALYTALDVIAKPVFEIAMGIALLAMARKAYVDRQQDPVAEDIRAGRVKNGKTAVGAAS